MRFVVRYILYVFGCLNVIVYLYLPLNVYFFAIVFLLLWIFFLSWKYIGFMPIVSFVCISLFLYYFLHRKSNKTDSIQRYWLAMTFKISRSIGRSIVPRVPYRVEPPPSLLGRSRETFIVFLPNAPQTTTPNVLRINHNYLQFITS